MGSGRERFRQLPRRNLASTPSTTGIRALTGYKPLADARLDQIAGELGSAFTARLLRKGKLVSTANNYLRVLRRILNLAVEWGVLGTAPKIKTLPGQRHRERVVSPKEEAHYLAAAPDPLPSVATLLADSGPGGRLAAAQEEMRAQSASC